MSKTTAVATTGGDEQLPAFLKGYGNVVNEDNFDSSDVVIPKIKLLQGLSKEVEAFDDAKAGRFWHTGLDMSLGESMRFVVADRRKKFLLTAPLADGQGILARADDAKTWDRHGKWQVKIKGLKDPVTWEIKDRDILKSGLTEWGTMIPGDENSPPAATLFYDYLVFLPDHLDLGPAVISLARSQIKKAKKGLNDKIKLHGTNGRPMQALIFEAKSVEESGDEGPYKNWQFTGSGFVQDEALFKMALEHKGALADVKIADEADDGAAEVVADDGKGNF
jgi:hypothetical protein